MPFFRGIILLDGADSYGKANLLSPALTQAAGLPTQTTPSIAGLSVNKIHAGEYQTLAQSPDPDNIHQVHHAWPSFRRAA